ncbi:hypothetical protein EV143_11394 [Flavobacterium chryseum]|uniref:hypothetical protein n=1 Tax=Flavobacterium sp. P3160 TaxID=2512113 RepID=UPI00105BEBA0|nr:hypothetical protein [Flavobacterium sp. P3160]TDO69917.1 hypothetical protein EV143_11394 [Flavobacterium sp. P3160]
MNLKIILQNLKAIGIVLIALAAVWFYKDYTFQKSENERQSENSSQLRKADSTKFASQLLSKDEIADYLKFQNSDLNKKLQANNIKLNRIESIVSQTYKFRDTTKRETDLSGIVEAIKSNIPSSQVVVDTTKCMTTKGIISFKDNKLTWTVLDRTFENKSDAVAYWERREWKFLGIKTRLFGKKQFTSKVFDECGESRVMKIEKKK